MNEKERLEAGPAIAGNTLPLGRGNMFSDKVTDHSDLGLLLDCTHEFHRVFPYTIELCDHPCLDYKKIAQIDHNKRLFGSKKMVIFEK